MPEGLTWMENAKVNLALIPGALNPVEVQIYAETAKVSLLIALVEELRKTNAILKHIQRGK